MMRHASYSKSVVVCAFVRAEPMVCSRRDKLVAIIGSVRTGRDSLFPFSDSGPIPSVSPDTATAVAAAPVAAAVAAATAATAAGPVMELSLALLFFFAAGGEAGTVPEGGGGGNTEVLSMLALPLPLLFPMSKLVLLLLVVLLLLLLLVV